MAGSVHSIETIDVASNAVANVLTLSAQDVVDVSDTYTLTVLGTAVDSVNAGTGWTDSATAADGSHVYTQSVGGSLATLIVQAGVAVNSDIAH